MEPEKMSLEEHNCLPPPHAGSRIVVEAAPTANRCVMRVWEVFELAPLWKIQASHLEKS